MLHLVIGGNGSGKSAYGEKLMMEEPEDGRIYLATMRPWDEEGREKIEKHQRMRSGKGFVTMECYGRLRDCPVPWGSSVLLECMGNLLTNVFFDRQYVGMDMAQVLTDDIMEVDNRTRNLVIVTNDIFGDGLFYGVDTEAYRAVLGQVNKNLARAADHVTEVVYGVPLKIK